MKLPFFWFLLLVAPLSAWAVPSGPETVQKGWDSAASLQSNEAFQSFHDARPLHNVDPREADLGMAIALLEVQPKTEGNINHSAALLDRLVRQNPDDAIGIEARYFQARIESVHRDPADPAKAVEIFRSLIHDHPESPMAQLAVSKLAILTLYKIAPPKERPARFAELEQLGNNLTDPVAACDFHLVMGTAALDFKLPDQKAFDHFAAADKLGVPSIQTQADNLVRLGRLAVHLGHKDLAQHYWGQFVHDFSHDNRNYAIRQELIKLGGTP